MSAPLRVLCLFSSPALHDASFFARHGGHWTTDLDQGRCELVPLVLDGEVDALAASGLFVAATVLCRPADLGPPLAVALRAADGAFERARLPLELVTTEQPVSTLAWLAEHAPALVPRCRVDGEIRPESPSWWRDRVRGHLARAADGSGDAGAPAEDLGAELRAFVARRGG